MSESISPARSRTDYEAFAALVSEYMEWCRVRYQLDAWFVERVFGYQGFNDCATHPEYPAELLPCLVFMELPLRR